MYNFLPTIWTNSVSILSLFTTANNSGQPIASFLVLSINWEWRISEIFPNSDLKNLVLVLGDFQWPSASLLPAPCADLELGSHFCFWKGKETDIMNDFYCAIFQTLLNAFEWDGNCSALCHSQNKQNIFPKPGCVFFSNWQ